MFYCCLKRLTLYYDLRQWDALASSLFASAALGMLGGRPATRIGLALLGAWLGLAASLYCSVEFWFVAWATVVTYIAYFLGDITRLGGAGRLGMIAFFVGTYQVLTAFPSLGQRACYVPHAEED